MPVAAIGLLIGILINGDRLKNRDAMPVVTEIASGAMVHIGKAVIPKGGHKTELQVSLIPSTTHQSSSFKCSVMLALQMFLLFMKEGIFDECFKFFEW